MRKRIIAFMMAAVMALAPAGNALAAEDILSAAAETESMNMQSEEADLNEEQIKEIEEIAERKPDADAGTEADGGSLLKEPDAAELYGCDADDDAAFEPEDSETMLYLYRKAREAAASEEAAAAAASSEDLPLSEETELLSSPDGLYADFPESYRLLLIKLHKLYPRWEFVADHTGLDWNDALDEEATSARSLVENSEPDSWKSRKDADYDASTGKWKVYDGSVWVAAGREAVAYYMDPRNWMQVVYSSSTGELIKNKSIFQFLDYSYDPSVQTREGTAKMAAGSFLAGTPEGESKSYVDMIMNAASEWGMSPYVLTAFIIQEQGKEGKSPLISGKQVDYPGLYNFLNVGAYATSSMTNVQRGLWWAGGEGKGNTSYGRPWDSRKKAISGGAQYLSENYLQEFQNTIYYKRFNVNPDNTKRAPYTHQYMTNVAGAWAEGYLLGQSCENNGVLYENYTFHIPVYDNMPESPCAEPEDTMLSELSVRGFELAEEFAIDRTAYTVTVPAGTQQVTVDAAPVARTASVSGTGVRTLTGDTTRLDVTVTSRAGSRKTVTLTVIREEQKLFEAIDLTNNQSIFIRFYQEAPGAGDAASYRLVDASGNETAVSYAGMTEEGVFKINFPDPLKAGKYTLCFDNGQGVYGEAAFTMGLDISVYEMRDKHSIILQLSSPIVGCTDPENYYVYPLDAYDRPLEVESAVSAFEEVHRAARNVFTLTFKEELIPGQTYVAETRNMSLWKDNDESSGIVGEKCQGTICYFTYDGLVGCEVIQIADKSNIIVRFAEPVDGCTRENNYMVISSDGMQMAVKKVASAFTDMKGEVANVFRITILGDLPDDTYTVRTRGMSSACRDASFTLDSGSFLTMSLIRREEKSIYVMYDRDVDGCTDPANYVIIDNYGHVLVPGSVQSAYSELGGEYPRSFRIDFDETPDEGMLSIQAVMLKENGRYLNVPYLLVRGRI